MNTFETNLDKLLKKASDLIKAGRKDEAREVLRQALAADRNNLQTWELLWHAAYTKEEELSSVRHILQIDPRHVAAKKRLKELEAAGINKSNSQPLSRTPTKGPTSLRNRQQASTLLLLLGVFVSVVCLSTLGLALFRGGYIPFNSSSNLTATALSEKNASCQALIDRTIQASRNYCDNTNSNTACYGNNKLKADLVPNAIQRFSERGDMIPVNGLRRLSASPLNLENDEWGIAVFKVVANLPRSLPGETVTMVVFGNATLDNQSGESDSLESFYFSSELGQIVCEKIPFDGMMVSSPDGSGIRFSINGAELTLMGNASIKAIKNDKMEISVYQGSARIVSNGQEQYLGAGEQSNVKLGGANGSESISGPSAPEAITGEELTMACTLSGQYCSPDEIKPITEGQAQSEIQGAITSTPIPTPTETITRTPSPTPLPTFTLVVLPSATPSPKPTRTATATQPTSTRTPGPISTIPGVFTSTQTTLFTPTNTPIPSATSVAPSQSLCSTVSIGPLTNPNSNLIAFDITNNNGTTITINRFFAYWIKSPNSQKLARLALNSVVIWNTSDPDSPSDIPLEGNWVPGADLTIPDTNTRTFLIQFQNNLQPTGYEIHIVFDIGCQIIASQ